MQYLFRHAHVHQPKDVGIQDILVAGSTIVAMGKELDVSLPDLEVIDLHGMDVIPGLIDQHVHIIGGGGGRAGKSCPAACLQRLCKSGGDGACRYVGNRLPYQDHPRFVRQYHGASPPRIARMVPDWFLRVSVTHIDGIGH